MYIEKVALQAGQPMDSMMPRLLGPILIDISLHIIALLLFGNDLMNGAQYAIASRVDSKPGTGGLAWAASMS